MQTWNFTNVLLAAILFHYTYSVPINRDAAAVTNFLTTIASQDTRTDSLVTLNYQNMASKKSPDHDNAKDPLFTQVDGSVNAGPIYTQIATLSKFYQHDSEIPIDSDFSTAIANFIDTIVETTPMTAAWTFLQSLGLATNDKASFKTQLYNLWFLPYARKSVTGSCGFKSVFVGEITEKTVTSFSNWYGFYLQEASGDINYHGWFTKINVSVKTPKF
ncbi:unnamed protein product [Caenorhabditis bovis]|uniref:EndoU domain-containing protein n=1 Tax=Caenorhabditis bovis TaxID=2654633 RepID=A0A8S1EJA1_9PELO|nr:unnamed protein product [Caenorhabditis bovis]